MGDTHHLEEKVLRALLISVDIGRRWPAISVGDITTSFRMGKEGKST
jgi:hypothetical protein